MAKQEDSADEYALGIDVGSTSIKATIVRRSDSKSVAQERLQCTATYAVNDGVRSEQNVALIVEHVDRCLQALPAVFLNRIINNEIPSKTLGVQSHPILPGVTLNIFIPHGQNQVINSSGTEFLAKKLQNLAEIHVLLIFYPTDDIIKLVSSLLHFYRPWVVAIGICGQMHGVVCWSSKERPWSWKHSLQHADNDDVFVDESKVSHHYTWQDSRCTPDFLASLPSTQSHLSVHTGYGCATLFWLKAHEAETMRKFDRAATIADFVVAMLCDLDTPQTSPQNAASWGYFDTENNRFEASLLHEANFPTHMLPHVRPDNGVAGTLRRPWRGIRAGVVVGVALGDLQAFVRAILRDENEAIVNVSTSAQMVFVDRNFVPNKAEKTAAKVVPYFDGKYLYEGAAINGGNAISLFVDFVAESVRSLGCEVTKDQIWCRLIEGSRNRQLEKDSMPLLPIFVPTFWGERRCPLQRASICQLTPDNFNLTALFQALCAGIIDNIHELVPLALLRQRGINKIVATGTALLRNETLQLELQNRYAPMPVHSDQSASADSAVGSALAVIQLLDSN